MKKYLLPISSILILILNFVVFWYIDSLMSSFFLLPLIIIGIALLALLVCIICSVVFIILNPKEILRYVSLIVSLMTVVLILFFPFRMAKTKLELALFENDRYTVIQMVQAGEIQPDHIGNAELPDRYRKTSASGQIFIYQNDDEQVITFWIFRGLLSGSVELIYSSQDEGLIYANETGHPITEIIELRKHWYYVKTDY